VADLKAMKHYFASSAKIRMAHTASPCLTWHKPREKISRHRMEPHLFVYGTLMSTAPGAFGKAMRERLQSEAQLLGPAAIRGRLYDLGRYPALVDSDDPADLVHGQVFALREPGKSFAWLDRYEGIVPGQHGHNEYQRVQRPVRLARGEDITAWVYIYCKSVARAPRIAAGRWDSV
jgi:gamma-glutamylcyclotransferase (GGCT)/AIG2-like uncharacterized protein YtfP